MCPKTNEQFEEIRSGKRRHILDSAIECFASTGYHAVSISDLAKHAGISKGLMYNYFCSKEELLKAIYSEVISELMGLFGHDGSGEINREILNRNIENLFSHMKSNLMLWKMYMAIFSQPAVLQILSKEIKESSAEPMGMIERYFTRRGYDNPALEVAFLGTLFSGATYEYVADPEQYPLDMIKKRILSMYQDDIRSLTKS